MWICCLLYAAPASGIILFKVCLVACLGKVFKNIFLSLLGNKKRRSRIESYNEIRRIPFRQTRTRHDEEAEEVIRAIAALVALRIVAEAAREFAEDRARRELIASLSQQDLRILAAQMMIQGNSDN